MLHVFVEPFRPKEDAGLLRKEECRQLSSWLFPSHFLPQHRPPLLQELQQLQKKPRPARQVETQGWVGVVLGTFQQTPRLHGQVQAERQSLQSEMSEK